MATQSEHMQQLWKQYETEHDHLPTGTRPVVEWAVRAGKLKLPTVDPMDLLAKQMSKALREEFDTDEKGRRFRVNHSIRIMENGVQQTFWGIMGFASRDFMEKTFTQRREGVINDCVQLKTDVDVYNDRNPHEEAIQIVLDFTEDVAERQVDFDGDTAGLDD